MQCGELVTSPQQIAASKYHQIPWNWKLRNHKEKQRSNEQADLYIGIDCVTDSMMQMKTDMVQQLEQVQPHFRSLHLYTITFQKKLWNRYWYNWISHTSLSLHVSPSTSLSLSSFLSFFLTHALMIVQWVLYCMYMSGFASANTLCISRAKICSKLTSHYRSVSFSTHFHIDEQQVNTIILYCDIFQVQLHFVVSCSGGLQASSNH